MGRGPGVLDAAGAGIPFDRGRLRVERLAESVEVLKTLLAGEECTFQGRFYRVQGHRIPAPAQAPRPPILIGGNGPRLLEPAARQADAVGFTGFSHKEGGRVTVPDAFGHRFPPVTIDVLEVDPERHLLHLRVDLPFGLVNDETITVAPMDGGRTLVRFG